MVFIYFKFFTEQDRDQIQQSAALKLNRKLRRNAKQNYQIQFWFGTNYSIQSFKVLKCDRIEIQVHVPLC